MEQAAESVQNRIYGTAFLSFVAGMVFFMLITSLAGVTCTTNAIPDSDVVPLSER